MGNKVSIGTLTASLAQETGKSKKVCEDFIREFFHIAAETLTAGESLRIKGFGTFKVVEVESRESVSVTTGERQEIAAYKKVVFTPAKEMASVINAPFENFESAELDDEMPDELLFDNDNISKNEDEELSDENLVSKGVLEAGSVEEDSDDAITQEAYKELEKENKYQRISQEEAFVTEPAKSVETPVNTVGSNVESPDTKPIYQPSEKTYQPMERMTPPDLPPRSQSDAMTAFQRYKESKDSRDLRDYRDSREEVAPRRRSTTYNKEPKKKKSRFGIGFLTGALTMLVICVIVFMLGCFFDWWPLNFGSSKENKVAYEQEYEPQGIEESQSEDYTYEPTYGSESEETSSSEPVYDTVSSTRYLTTIAREHYGDSNFWPYIYLENESVLGHPDQVAPGTRLVIPPLSKYGVNPSNKADVTKAKKEAAAIYAKYPKQGSSYKPQKKESYQYQNQEPYQYQDQEPYRYQEPGQSSQYQNDDPYRY